MENAYISYIALDRFVAWVYICITIFFSSVVIYFVFLCSGYIADYMSSSLWLDLLVFMFKGYNISSEGKKSHKNSHINGILGNILHMYPVCNG